MSVGAGKHLISPAVFIESRGLCEFFARPATIALEMRVLLREGDAEDG